MMTHMTSNVPSLVLLIITNYSVPAFSLDREQFHFDRVKNMLTVELSFCSNIRNAKVSKRG